MDKNWSPIRAVIKPEPNSARVQEKLPERVKSSSVNSLRVRVLRSMRYSPEVGSFRKTSPVSILQVGSGPFAEVSFRSQTPTRGMVALIGCNVSTPDVTVSGYTPAPSTTLRIDVIES